MVNSLLQPGFFLLAAETTSGSPWLKEHPGFYFVIATLLPLASFVLILLAFGMWCVFRPYRDTNWGSGLYNLFGGDRPGPLPAYVATGAIGLAFVFSLTGFVLYTSSEHEDLHTRQELSQEAAHSDHQLGHTSAHEKKLQEKLEKEPKPAGADKEKLEKELKETREKKKKLEEDLKETRENLDKAEARWAGRFNWLSVAPAGLKDPKQATVLQLGFFVDGLTALMFLMVTLVATLIHIFSIGYMSDELEETVEDHQVHTEDGHLRRRGRFGRFFLYLSLFCFSMLNLVLADNLFQVFLSWELVGICSYLLIGFYYERQSASNAANKAFITNRIGDAGFIVGLLIIWTYVGTFNFQDVFKRLRCPPQSAHEQKLDLHGRIVRGQILERKDGELVLTVQPGVHEPVGNEVILFPRSPDKSFVGVEPDQQLTVKDDPRPNEYGHIPTWVLIAAGLGVFLGCVGKSAQFPLQVWLPDAMEGPTPVSALIHAATMVAAGVYLVGRAYPLFTHEALLVIAYTGGITLFVAATIAVVMTDIKKVLAYSTVSQLGYMMLALGVGGWIAGLFHLVTHAVFKALLFLGSGSVIHGCHHEQDMTKMGGLFPKMKITALTMLAGLFAIAGIPLFTGWYSKDSIVVQSLGFARVYPQHGILFVLPLVTAGITAFYMSRMWLLTFTGKPRDRHVYEHAHESPWLMTGPLVVLAVLSVCAAWGWPLWDAKASLLEKHIHHAQPLTVLADYGLVLEEGEHEIWTAGRVIDNEKNVRLQAHLNHDLGGGLALLMVIIGGLFAVLVYGARVLDPNEATEQFPVTYRFLNHKWYFDELYSAIVVRPAMVVAVAFRWFDQTVIDGIINGLAWLTVRVANWDGIFDRNVIDGTVNLIADVFYGVGARLRTVQTGNLRSYVLFLVLAAVGIYVVLSYFVAMASAG